MHLNEKALDAARDEVGTNHDGIITAYLSALPMPEDVKELVAEWKKAAEGVTPGPWGTDNSGTTVLYKSDNYNRNLPFVDVCRPGLSDSENEQDKLDAEWIARCSPIGIAPLLSALASLSAKVEELTRERDEWKNAAFLSDCEAHSGQTDEYLARAEAAEASLADRDRIIAEKDKALERIASCQSFHPDDVVAIARAALKEHDND